MAVIRAIASADELNEVRRIIEQIFPEIHAYYALKGLRNHRILVAVEDNRVVGFIQFKVVKSGNVNIGHIYYMGVLPEFRGRGIGTELVCKAEEELIKRRADCIIASTQRRNIPVIRIFSKLGYAITDWDHVAEILKSMGADIEDSYDLMWLIYDYDEVVLFKMLTRAQGKESRRVKKRVTSSGIVNW